MTSTNHGDSGPLVASDMRSSASELSGDTDLQLLRRWAEGSREAGTELFDRHFEALSRFFRNKAGEAAEDLIQSTFLACLEQPDRFQERSSFRSYLLSIARFKLYAYFRSGGVRRRRARFNTTSAFCGAPSPASAAIRRDEDINLLRALRSIPIEQQIILELAFWEDLSGAELAEVLELPINTVYTRIFRAKRTLREALRALEGER